MSQRISNTIKRTLCSFLVFCTLCTYFCFSGSAASTTRTPISPDDYWGKQQLATLDNGKALVYAYEQLADGIETCDSEITLSSFFRNYYISWDEFQTVLYTYIRDYPQHFWLGNSYSYRTNSSGKITSFIPSYLLSDSDLTVARQQFNTAVQSVLDNITDDMTEPEIEQYIHDYLADRITYIGGRTHSHNAYGALVEGKSVCEGYAEAFQYLLYQSGILCVTVTGNGYSDDSTEPEPHAWSLVQIDSEFYYVDLTWNDQDMDAPFYAYYNVTTENMSRDHTLDVYPYDYPVCTATAANYFTINGGALNTLDLDEIANVFHKTGNVAQFRITDETFDFWSEFSTNRSAITKRINVIGSAGYSAYSLQDIYYVILNGQLRGDVNADKRYDETDLSVLLNHCLGTTPITNSTLLKAADVNQDGKVNICDHQRLYEHVNQTRYINTIGEGIPTSSDQTITLELQPETDQVIAYDDPVEMTYTVSLAPSPDTQVSVFTATIDLPNGVTLKDAKVQSDLSEYFDVVLFDGTVLTLSGCKTPITKTITLGTLSVQFNDCTNAKTYTLSASNGICASNTEAHTFAYTCGEVTIELPDPDVVAAQAVTDQIGALSIPVTLADEATVKAARNAYDSLTDTQKSLVTNLQTLIDAETTIKTLQQEKADREAAQAVIDQIAALQVQSTNDEAAVKAARNAYNSLTDTQKSLVTNLEALTAAEETLAQLIAKEQADQSAAKVVQEQIDALQVQSLTDEAAVKAARNAYNNLTLDQRVWVTNLAKLQDAETTLAQLKLDAEQKAQADQAAANAVICQIAALNVQSVSDEPAVTSARSAYDLLTDDQKLLITNLDALQKAEADITRLKQEAEQKKQADQAAANAVEEQIAALDVQSLADEAAVCAAREAYSNLTADQKVWVSNLAKLQEAEATIAELKIARQEQEEADKAAAQKVIDQINALNVQSVEDAVSVKAVRDAYNKLTDTQKNLVTNVTKLQDAEDAIAQLYSEAEQKEQADRASAKTVEDLIAALNLQSVADEASVLAARNAYEHLTDDQKAWVTNLSVLESAESTLDQWKQENEQKQQNDQAAAKAVQELIAALESHSANDEEAVRIARDAYDTLTEEQKSLVTNYSKLLDAEAHLNTLHSVVYGDTDSDGKVTAADALIVLKSVVGKITLTEEQLVRADTDGNGKADAVDALYILKKVVGKLQQFPVEQ